MSTPDRPKLVLDTNVVLDWLHFSDPACAELRRAVLAGEVSLITSKVCLEELEKVTERPEFGLNGAAQAILMQQYRQHASIVDTACADLVRLLPVCRDPDDQKFLELAAAGAAQGLLSRDKALLRLEGRLRRQGASFSVLIPADFGDWINRLRSGGFPVQNPVPD